MIEQLDRLGLYLNQPEPAILCIQCKFALKADGDRVSRHLVLHTKINFSRVDLFCPTSQGVELIYAGG
ncbi:hypothetical protein B0J15DRAFT_59904 [Fusarium solani]|uniref:Uncharacterized protein n=1 Tax=Fusarium solani TaxID=169388 RepID=A0A9P9H0P4_FUSSL|nr:uncharacterized protein B0J15DRAFT_59904 [Fusarium solani]KAH7248228.1 hypothetical protein B0J15DRAFT_59904 [Fusarium solani]